MLSLWIPLADVDEQTGTLALAKGSHREMLPMEAPSDSRYRFSRGSEHHARLKPERMRFGDVLAFHSMTLREHTKDLGIPTCPPLPGCSAELTLAIRRLLSDGTHQGRIPQRVRWSIDMRFSDASNGLQWASDGYLERFPALEVAALGTGGGGRTSWEEWREAWGRARGEWASRL